MNYLAFDLGGGSGKLLLGKLEEKKLCCQTIHSFENYPIEINGHLYWDILHIYDELCIGLKKAVEITGDQIRCIGFDSFCNDYVLVSENGEMLSPVHCYRDERTARVKEHTYGVMSPEELYRINGNQMALFNTLLQLDAMQTQGQEWLLEHCYKILFVSDYFLYLLTGKMVTEYTTASVTQMFDFKTDDWSEEILRKFRIRKSLFAPIVRPGTVIGNTTEEFNRRIHSGGFQVAAVCAHDTASAFLASVAQEKCAIISCGTWCIVGMETEKPVISKEGFQNNIANEGSIEGHHRLLCNVMGTWIIQEIVRELAEQGTILSYGELEELASKSNMPEMFIDVDAPEFFQPGQMMEKVSDFCRKYYGAEPDDIGQMVYCVYESLAFKYRCSIEKLEKMTGTRLDVINMLGGGSKSDMMCQITANICKRPVLAGPQDATSLGNFLVQMIAGGEIKSVEEGRAYIRDSEQIKEFIPDENPRWEMDFQRFMEKIV